MARYDGRVITYHFRCRDCGEYDLEPVAKQTHYHPCMRTGEEFHQEITLVDFPAEIGKKKK